MSTTRYSDGTTTVTLDGDLEALVRQAIEGAAGETIRILEGAAEAVANEARATWYDPQGGGVTRRTGKSGDIQVVTTITPEEVTVSVGSTDLEKAKYVHRPGRLSTVATEISRDDYSAAKKRGGTTAKTVFHAKKDDEKSGVLAGRYYLASHNPAASDGKFLLPELIAKPMRARVRSVGDELADAILKQMRGA